MINLVIAAREFWDANNDLSAESRALDKALEAFAERVPYENQPDDANEATERCRGCDGYNCDDGCAYPDASKPRGGDHG